MLSRKEEPLLTYKQLIGYFFAAHWRGVLCFCLPLIFCPILIPFPGDPWKWCAFTLLLMGIFWVSECIPLPVTGFIPVMIFPLAGVLTTDKVCGCYINDSIVMFLGSLMLAYSVEQSGLHKRLAYVTIRCIGYSHLKLLMAMCVVTTFVSMWITNTAATTMMVPITFAILKVFEDEGLMKIYEKNADGELQASDITACYFCAVTFSATIGGIGTLVGTATNLVFKGLFQNRYAMAPEYLSFPKFSAFAVPYMVVLEIFCYLYLAIMYFGMCRPNSVLAKSTAISEKGKEAAKKTIDTDLKKLGSITFWEWMVVFLFGGAMVGFFCRSPQIFTGWGDRIYSFYRLPNIKFVGDSALAMLVSFLMLLLPSSLEIFKNFKCNYHEELPKTSVLSVLDWRRMNAVMPYSFMFLLGGGFALSTAASLTGLNAKIGAALSALKDFPNLVVLLLVIIVVIFVTNFASNVAVANVFVPISMQLAEQILVNPLWYVLAAGYTASYCFMIPVGTPGNLIVQSAAKIPTMKMIKAGLGPTITTILITWLAIAFYAPYVWPSLKVFPYWAVM